MEQIDYKENLRAQLAELETLQSMFCNPGEIEIGDYSTLIDINDYTEDKLKDMLPNLLEYAIDLNIQDKHFIMSCSCPREYPSLEVPDIYVRNEELDRRKQHELNTDLNAFILNSYNQEVCIFSGITWLQDNAISYITNENTKESEAQDNIDKTINVSRYWIYSHHIYSKMKRREIINLAHYYSLSGFCLPGKPGVICIEGLERDCIECWAGIRSMTWKKITCKYTEVENDVDLSKFKKFSKFEEISFHCENKSNHSNMGEFNKFLEEHDCSYIIKDLFGL